MVCLMGKKFKIQLDENLKKLLFEIGTHRLLIGIVAVTGIIYSVAYSRVALLMKDLTDLLGQGNTDGIKKVIWVCLSLSLVSNVSRYFHIYLMNYLTELVGQSLRNKLENKFCHLSLSFHGAYTTGPGGLISRTLSDVRTIQDGLRMVADIFLHPLLFILLMGNLIYLDWKLTLFSFSVLPLVIMFLKNLSRSIRKYTPMGFKFLEDMTVIVKETLDGARIIQSFSLSEVIQKKFRDVGRSYTGARRMVHSRTELAGPLTEMIAVSIFMLVLFYITKQVALGISTTGSFLAYTTSLVMLNPSLKRAQETYVRIQEVLVASGRVYQLIEAPHEVSPGESDRDFPSDWGSICFEKVSLNLGGKTVLEQISFKVKRGETVAFVGASGSGKSSILNLLLRFFEPSSGEILVDQVPIHKFNLQSLRKQISLVSQDVFLFNDSIEYNIQAGDFDRSQEEVPQVAQSAHAYDFILQKPDGFKTMVGDRGLLLSGGEKQRISIARAMFKDAPILILDEATSALDSSSEFEVQKGLEVLMKGRTTFIVTHRFSMIQTADSIYVIKDGIIVEKGKHMELLKKGGEYCHAYQLQVSG